MECTIAGFPDAECTVHACATCFANKSTCAECLPLYGDAWHADQRPCTKCLDREVNCLRARILASATDQDAKSRKAAIELADERSVPDAGVYQCATFDNPHNLRIVVRGAMLHVLFNSDGVAITFYTVLAFKTCAHKDVSDSVGFVSNKVALLADKMAELHIAILISLKLQKVIEQ